jgi:predicted DNA-binding transcriptional regulator AlpA
VTNKLNEANEAHIAEAGLAADEGRDRPQRMFRLVEVLPLVGLSRSQLLALIKAEKFPAPFALSDTGRAVAWFESDITAWQKALRAAPKRTPKPVGKHRKPKTTASEVTKRTTK